jgi:hypothetical protein
VVILKSLPGKVFLKSIKVVVFLIVYVLFVMACFVRIWLFDDNFQCGKLFIGSVMVVAEKDCEQEMTIKNAKE